MTKADKILWMQLIDAESEEEFDMLTKTNIEPIKKAVVAIKQMDADEEMRAIAFQRETAIRDKISALKFARSEGREEGRKEGQEETTLNYLKRIINDLGFTPERALALFGVPKEEWDKYLSQLT